MSEILDISDKVIQGVALSHTEFVPDAPDANSQARSHAPNSSQEIDYGALLQKATMTSTQLRDMEIPSRTDYLGGWFREGDYGLLIAERGVGKTWMAMALANAIAAGKNIGPWAAGEGAKVLYVDGEMPLELAQSRDQGLCLGGELLYLHEAQVFKLGGKPMNIRHDGWRDGLTAMCNAEDIKVIVLDNLSCLASGIQENDALEWESISNWILELRRMDISVLMLHHAGRNGQARGTSKREDIASWVIHLRADQCAADQSATFTSRFAKNPRSMAKNIGDYRWEFRTNEEGAVTISHTAASVRERMVSLIEDGFTSATELAEVMEISKGRVSQVARELMNEDPPLITKNGREYRAS